MLTIGGCACAAGDVEPTAIEAIPRSQSTSLDGQVALYLLDGDSVSIDWLRAQVAVVDDTGQDVLAEMVVEPGNPYSAEPTEQWWDRLVIRVDGVGWRHITVPADPRLVAVGRSLERVERAQGAVLVASGLHGESFPGMIELTACADTGTYISAMFSEPVAFQAGDMFAFYDESGTPMECAPIPPLGDRKVSHSFFCEEAFELGAIDVLQAPVTSDGKASVFPEPGDRVLLDQLGSISQRDGCRYVQVPLHAHYLEQAQKNHSSTAPGGCATATGSGSGLALLFMLALGVMRRKS
jgi:MYXO-CTERM domain-containing protein